MGLDVNRACLELARRRLARCELRCEVEFVSRELAELGDLVGRYDFAWCAQSLYSFRDPPAALRQMMRTCFFSNTRFVPPSP